MLSIAELLLHNAKAWPDRPAYISNTRRLSWGEVAQRSLRLAAGLARQGIGSGDVVAMLSGDSHETVEHWYACALLGAVRTSINYRYSSAEIAHILAQSRAAALLVRGGECEEKLRESADLADHAPGVVIGMGAHDCTLDYEELLAASAPLDRPAPTDGSALLAISYTSGTTGMPKGARWRHDAVLAAQHHTFFQAGFQPDDVFMHCSPSAGVPIVSATWNVLNGACVILEHDFTAESLIDRIEQERVTSTLWVPTVLFDVVESSRLATADTSSLRLVVYGSAPATPALIKRAIDRLGCQFQQWYGSTEGAGGWYAMLNHDDHLRALAGEPELLASAGRPTLHCDVWIADEWLQRQEPGVVGDIMVSGPTVFDGYLDNPTATAEALHPKGLRTGDIGWFDEDGYLHIADRRDGMIITGGYNVLPSAVENVIADVPGVAAVCVVGVPHPRWGEAVCAAIIAREGLDEATVREHCSRRLARFEIPKEILFVDALPTGATGKVLRREVAALIGRMVRV